MDRTFLAVAALSFLVAACGPPPGPGPGGGGCRALTSQDVSGGVTLAKGCYTAAATLVVSGGTLLLDPGVTVSMAKGAGLRIGSGAGLKAVGTQANPIVLKGEEMNPGTWKGVAFFDSTSADNDLVYVTITEGGGAPWTAASNSAANLAVFGTSKVKMDHGTISTGEAAGFIAEGELDLTRSVSTDNPFAGWVTPAGVANLGTTNDFSNNTLDQLRIEDATTLDASTTWPDLGIPYFVMEGFTVGQGARLTVGPGVEVESAPSVMIRIGAQGTLEVDGTSARPAGFVAFQTLPGTWKGLRIDSTTASVLHYTTVGSAGTDPTLDNADIYLDGSLAIDHATVGFSAGWGISLRTGAHLTGCPTVTFTANMSGDVKGNKASLSDCP